MVKIHNSSIHRKGASSNNPHRSNNNSNTNMRSKATIQRLNMYQSGRPKRNKEGTVIGGDLMMSNRSGGQLITNSSARIAPDRRWFNNTRTINQIELDKFRDEMSLKESDPYSVLLRRKKIPMALLQDIKKNKNMNLLDNEKFESVFGKNTQRKKPKLTENLISYENLIKNVENKIEEYNKDTNKDSQLLYDIDINSLNNNNNNNLLNNNNNNNKDLLARKDDLFSKGQSKRIWGELYKVLDCSDVVLQIVDARNIPGTRCLHVEKYIKKNNHKHLIIIINKCDLVPNWVTRRWVKILSNDFPTIAFHAHLTKSFGKTALINLLRQFSKLHLDKRQISVGVIGYPNVGKSSVINTIVGTACCKAAPVPGETKIWQYISLTKRISLIDSPGIVYNLTDNDEVETVLKGVVRAERLESPTDYIAAIISRVKPEYIQKLYNIPDWCPNPNDIGHNDNNLLENIKDRKKKDEINIKAIENDYKLRVQEELNDLNDLPHIDLLKKMAIKMGKLLKGGEPDLKHVAVMIINDWQRGKLPYFVAPPRLETEEDENIDNDENLEEDIEENNNDDDSINNNDEEENGAQLISTQIDDDDEDNEENEEEEDKNVIKTEEIQEDIIITTTNNKKRKNNNNLKNNRFKKLELLHDNESNDEE